MSEVENQESSNGATNGDVPEIELIIKEEYCYANEPFELEDVRPRTPNQLHLTTEHRYSPVDFKVCAMQSSILDCNKQDICELKPFTFEIDTETDSSLNGKNKTFQSRTSSRRRSDLSDSVDHCNFASVVAEACDGLFDEIENELDLHLTATDDTKLIDNVTVKALKNEEYYSRGKLGDSMAMQSAVAAVLDEGMSLGQAAKKFNVVKSTIWSRVSKHPKHRRRKTNKELGDTIQSKLCAGMSLSEISRLLNVAKSTVHQHKSRLTKNGMLPPMQPTYRQSSGSTGKDIKSKDISDRLVQAYRGHRVNGMSVRFAAEFYSVPLTTLWRFIKRREAVTKDFPQKRLISKLGSDEKTEAIDDNIENISPSVGLSEIKTEIYSDDQVLFEQALLNQLFE